MRVRQRQYRDVIGQLRIGFYIQLSIICGVLSVFVISFFYFGGKFNTISLSSLSFIEILSLLLMLFFPIAWIIVIILIFIPAHPKDIAVTQNNIMIRYYNRPSKIIFKKEIKKLVWCEIPENVYPNPNYWLGKVGVLYIIPHKLTWREKHRLQLPYTIRCDYLEPWIFNVVNIDKIVRERMKNIPIVYRVMVPKKILKELRLIFGSLNGILEVIDPSTPTHEEEKSNERTVG